MVESFKRENFSRKKNTKKKFIKIKKCRFCVDRIHLISYLDIVRLRKYVTERGKIIPSRVTGTCTEHQKQLAMSIKRARFMALMPTVAD